MADTKLERTLAALPPRLRTEVEFQVLSKVLTLHAPDANPNELHAALAFSAVLVEDHEVLERLADA
jgi:hypothetical protein